ncbi:MAG: bifunctional biotin--[acetyl-CoA-carboxylase] ligase/biotin operon repressor BirA [Pseudomonadales bacterium]|nr:bifunctional biotin--[acetyl-CoA-carboxylase] ligase/biotin operon repressor BirA [Pseudomonadales bacterium]
MNSLNLLRLLADGDFHSGDILGQRLGVSRAAIWKGVRAIRNAGLEVHSRRGRGYCLQTSLELLDRELLLGQLSESSRKCLAGLELLISVDSTNTHCMKRIQAGEADLDAGEVYVCVAEQQTAGRGRRGRQWISPFGHNLYLSMIRAFDSGAAGLEGLSLVTGIALVRALRECGVSELAVKWPNDVLLRQAKIAGILLEMSGDVSGRCQVVFGIGLNIDHSFSGTRMQAVDQPWADLASCMPVANLRNRVGGRIIDHLIQVLGQFEEQGFRAFRDEWQSLHAYQDQPVEISNAAGITRGLARGVTDKGAFQVETEGGSQIFNGGEVSIRMKVGHDS